MYDLILILVHCVNYIFIVNLRQHFGAIRAKLSFPSKSTTLEKFPVLLPLRKWIPLEELRRAIVAIEEQDDELVAEVGGSPFNKEIREAPLPEGFRLSNIKAYERKAYPQDHLDHFNDLMELHIVSDQAKCTKASFSGLT